MKKTHNKIYLSMCSILSLVALALPLIQLYEKLYGEKATNITAINFFDDAYKSRLTVALLYGERSEMTRVLFMLIIALQVIAVVSAFKKSGHLMTLLYFGAAVVNIVTGIVIWNTIKGINHAYSGVLVLKMGMGTYAIILLGLIEVLLLVRGLFVREKSY